MKNIVPPKEIHVTTSLRPNDLRNKIITKVKTVQEEEFERQKKRIKRYRTNISKTEKHNPDNRSPSVNSISSDDSILSDSSRKKKAKRSAPMNISEDESHNGMRKFDFCLLLQTAL